VNVFFISSYIVNMKLSNLFLCLQFIFVFPIYFCVVLCIFFVLFYVLRVCVCFFFGLSIVWCKYVLYYCHRVSTQLQLTNISYSVTVEEIGSSFEMHFCSLCVLSCGIKILDEGIRLFILETRQ
jgi:hypothetical protein